MRHHNRIKKFGRERNQRKGLMRGLAYALLRDEKIRTTEVKAKALRPIVEKLITAARKNTVAGRRLLLERLPSKSIVEKLQKTIAVKYAKHSGGYTRVVKTGVRLSDGAKMAFIELV